MLRQVQGLKESGRGDDQRSVVYQTYTGRGATIAQVTALYAQSGVRLLALADIERAPAQWLAPPAPPDFALVLTLLGRRKCPLRSSSDGTVTVVDRAGWRDWPDGVYAAVEHHQAALLPIVRQQEAEKAAAEQAAYAAQRAKWDAEAAARVAAQQQKDPTR